MIESKNIFILENFEALGTLWQIEIFDENFKHVSEDKKIQIKNYLEKYIKDFETKYSRFLPDSILNKYNRGEFDNYLKDKDVNNTDILFDPELELSFIDFFEMIKIGEKYNYITQGAFNIYIKDKLENKGYGKAADKIGEEKSENKNIDLGGIGKGYLIDKIAEILQEKFSIKYFLINGGGDIYATSDNEKEIEIFLENPVEAGKFIGSVFIKNESFCCSSSFKRSWKNETGDHNHFVNTQREENILAASYVIYKNATECDILATCFCLLINSHNKLLEFLNSNNGKELNFEDLKYLVYDRDANSINSGIMVQENY